MTARERLLRKFMAHRFSRTLGGYVFVPLRREDIQKIRVWRNAQISVLRQKQPISEAEQARWYSEVVVPTHRAPRPQFLLVSILHGGGCVGYGGLTNIDWDHRRAEVSFLVDDSRMGQPEIHEADLAALLEFVKGLAFDDLGLHRLFTEIYAFRKRHIEVVERAGFLREGRLVHHTWWDGQPVDSVLHGLCRDEEARGGERRADERRREAMELVFRNIEERDLEMIMTWRTRPEVSAFMYTDFEPDMERQRKWYRKIAQDPHRIDWVINADGTDVGLLSIVEIDPRNRRAEWAYYLGATDTRGKGIGKSVELNVLQYVFETLGLHKLCCEVFSSNELVVKIHEKYGSFVEGVRREQIFKNDEYHDVVEMGILADTWTEELKGQVDFAVATIEAPNKEVVRVQP